MRRLVSVSLLVFLAVPAAAAVAAKLAPGDGTLGVRGGAGKVWLRDFKGVVIGRVEAGTLVVVDPVGGDCDAPLVWQADDQWQRTRGLGEDRVLECVYTTSTGMRFRLVGGQNTVRMNGYGISVSAVGKGTAYLKGVDRLDADGRYSLDAGDTWRSLPEDGLAVRIGSLP